MAKLEIGKKAPTFKLMDQSGKAVSLKDFKGKKVILYFYPKDLTPGCTQEASEFNSELSRIKRKKAVVLGVSADPVDRHEKFAEKLGLKFSLLSDEDKKTCRDYGVWKKKKLYGREFMGIERTTVIIDGSGKVENIFPKVKVKGHVEEVIDSL